MALPTEVVSIVESYFTPGSNLIFLEVGAAHPVNISVSFAMRSVAEQKRLFNIYYEHEWSGKEPTCNWEIISIEPNPNFISEFKRCNLPILEYAASSMDSTCRVPFYISPHPESCSSLEIRFTGNYPLNKTGGGWWPENTFQTVEVEVLTLDTILQRHFPNLNHIDVVLIDVEGFEMEVLKGFNVEKYYPKVLIVEMIGTNTAYDMDTLDKYIQDRLNKLGYKREMTKDQDVFYVRV